MTKQQATSIRRSLTRLAILPLLVVVAGCSKQGGGDSGAAAAASKKPPAGTHIGATTVTVAPAVARDISKVVDVTGSLVALQDVVVGAKQAGKLGPVSVHEGDPVHAGQVVAVMDLTDLQAQVVQAQANLRAAITKEDQARVQLSQAQNGVKSAETTLKWTDQTTQTAVALAQSAIDTAKERLAVVKKGAREQEREQAQEQVRAAQANFDKAKSDLARYQRLYREQAVSQSQLDGAQSAYDSAQATLNGAKQALSLIREGARPEDIRTAELAVRQAEDSFSKAQADRANVQLRREDLQNAKIGVQSARAAVAAAKAGSDQMRAALSIAQDALNNAYIKSPIDGFVAERRAEPGQQLGGGGAVMRIVSPKSVYFQAVLSESQYAEVKTGQDATITIDALPGRTYPGRVTRILPVASAAARSFTVRIDFPADAQVRPQMFARGSVLIDTHRRATIVPKDAVLFEPSKRTARVFVAGDGDVAKQRDITVGYTDRDVLEVLSGVRPGDKVIIAGQTALSDGDPIRVKELQPAEAPGKKA